MSQLSDDAVDVSPAAGRPRSADATEAVLKEALALAYDGGMANATIERIARQSGVAKTTIYRRWPNSAAILMDAFLEDIVPLIRYRRKASVQATFIATVQQLVQALQGERGDLLRHLLGAAQSDAELQEALQQRWIAPRRAEAMQVLNEAQQSGELSVGFDKDLLIDAIFGGVYYRLMIPYAPLSASYAEQLISQVFSGVVPQESQA